MSNAMSFIYPRTIELRRSKNISQQSPAIGGVGYSGREEGTGYADQENEIVIQSGIQCTIQAKGTGSSGAQILPGNISKTPQWVILTPPMDKGIFRDNDIIVDDEGYRYGVALNYWTPMGYNLKCIRLET